MPLTDLLRSMIAEQKRCNGNDELCRHRCKRCARLVAYRDAKRPI